MAKEAEQTDEPAGAEDAEEAPQDLPVAQSDADKVKGGVVGPCDRAKK
jgi:hypothetical protein